MEKDRIKSRVAVIAVHGVGMPELGETAKSISALLLRLRNPAGEPIYSEALETKCYFPGSEVPPPPKAKASPPPSGLRKTFVTDPTDFIASQLKGFRPKEADDTFETIRIRTVRKEAQEECEVDVYDLYWNDICRGGSGFLRFFVELYQLLFHLGALSEQSVATFIDSDENRKKSKIWQLYGFFVSAAHRQLSRVIFIFNAWLLIPALIVGFASASVISENCLLIGDILLALAAGGMLTGVTARVSGAVTGKTFGVWLGLCMVALLAGLILILPKENCTFLRIAGAFLLPMAGGSLILIKYNELHPHSLSIGFLIGTILSLIFAVCHYFLVGFDLASFYFTFATYCSLGTIVVLLILLVLVFITGLTALQWRLKMFQSEDCRVFITVLMGLGVSTINFSLLTTAAWIALFQTTAVVCRADPLRDALATHLLNLGTTGAGILVVSFGLFMAGAILILIPSLIYETFVSKRTDTLSIKAGYWLTIGGGSINVLIIFLYVSVVSLLIPILCKIVEIHSDYLSPQQMDQNWFLRGTILALGFAGVGFLGLKNTFDKFAVILGDVINRPLDVDEYLRVAPDNYTPKARIFCRYHALMRALLSPKPEAESYQSIVVIAHSQGSVISADYLRYCHEVATEADFLPSSGESVEAFAKPIHFLTMGNPIRQLYSWRFPTWYQWAWEGATADQLGVKSWSNIYGSADYVGRSLWQDILAESTYNFSPPRKTWEPGWKTIWIGEGKEKELCIGNVAHTHYWDTSNEIGSEVAIELDRMITSREVTSCENSSGGK